eukprot:CCRYP_020086-RA/>CCRYP_020086-RA protein AED:0.35 eAED:0.35 QI:0/0/0/1/0/0/2/0/102
MLRFFKRACPGAPFKLVWSKACRSHLEMSAYFSVMMSFSLCMLMMGSSWDQMIRNYLMSLARFLRQDLILKIRNIQQIMLESGLQSTSATKLSSPKELSLMQ